MCIVSVCIGLQSDHRQLSIDEVIGKLTDFLFNRIQAVRIINRTSDYIPVKSGVPQSSVLGPGLYMSFINDIVDIFGSGLTDRLVILYNADNLEIRRLKMV